jgi:hypothetical protein
MVKHDSRQVAANPREVENTHRTENGRMKVVGDGRQSDSKQSTPKMNRRGDAADGIGPVDPRRGGERKKTEIHAPGLNGETTMGTGRDIYEHTTPRDARRLAGQKMILEPKSTRPSHPMKEGGSKLSTEDPSMSEKKRAMQIAARAGQLEETINKPNIAKNGRGNSEKEMPEAEKMVFTPVSGMGKRNDTADMGQNRERRPREIDKHNAADEKQKPEASLQIEPERKRRGASGEAEIKTEVEIPIGEHYRRVSDLERLAGERQAEQSGGDLGRGWVLAEAKKADEERNSKKFGGDEPRLKKNEARSRPIDPEQPERDEMTRRQGAGDAATDESHTKGQPKTPGCSCCIIM